MKFKNKLKLNKSVIIPIILPLILLSVFIGVVLLKQKAPTKEVCKNMSVLNYDIFDESGLTAVNAKVDEEVNFSDSSFTLSSNNLTSQFNKGDYFLTIQPLTNANTINIATKNNTVTVKNAYKNTNIQYKFYQNFVKEFITLKNSDTNKTFEYKLNFSNNLAPQIESGFLQFVNTQTGEIAFSMPSPQGVDKNNNRIDYSYHLNDSGNLVVKPLRLWQFNCAKYPITIDPPVLAPNYSEALVMVGENTNEQGLKDGDIITVKPAGWNWGAKEKQRFAIVKIPTTNLDQIKNYSQKTININNEEQGFTPSEKQQQLNYTKSGLARYAIDYTQLVSEDELNIIRDPLKEFKIIDASNNEGVVKLKQNKEQSIIPINKQLATWPTSTQKPVQKLKNTLFKKLNAAGTITTSVGSSGRDYSTITAWEAACGGATSCSLTSNSEIAKGELYADSVFDETVTINGFTTSSSYYPIITVADGERHNGTSSGGGVVINPSTTGHAFDVQDEYVLFEWLRITDLEANSDEAFRINANYATIRNTLVHDLVLEGQDGVYQANTSYTVTVENSIFYDIARAGVHAQNFSGTVTQTWTVNNCTFYNTYITSTETSAGGIAIRRQGSSTVTVNVYNTISVDGNSGGVTDFDIADSAVTGDYVGSNNISSDSSAPGTSSQTSVTSASLFISTTATSENLHLSQTAPALNAGVTLGGFSDDIDGNVRPSGSAWDIGADEATYDGYSTGGIGEATIFWGFDEGRDNTCTDGTSDICDMGTTGLDLQKDSGIEWRDESVCYIGGCLAFNANNEYVYYSGGHPATRFGNGEDFTITAWVNRQALGLSSDEDIISTYESTGSDGGYRLYMASDGDIVFASDNNNTSFPADSVSSTSADYDDGNWHFVAVTRDTTADEINLYINGVLIDTDSAIAGEDISNNDDFNLGNGDTGAGGDFGGMLDEVKFYNYAKTPVQLSGDYLSYKSNRGVTARFGPANNQNTLPTEGLAVYLDAEDSSTASQTNKAIAGNDGSGTGVSFAKGKFGKGFDFEAGDGTDRIQIGDNPRGSQNGSYTVAAWIKPETGISGGNLSQPGFIANIAGNPNFEGAMQFYLSDSDGSLGLYFYDGTDYPSVNSSQTSWTAGTWYHVAGVFDDDNDTLTLYINGSEDGQTTSVTTNPNLTANTTDLFIGNNSNITGDYDGVIDEFMFFNSALTSDQISTIYNYTISGPLLHWAFDENSGTSTVYNSVPFGFDGTMDGIAESAWVPGITGSAIHFDGTNDRVYTSDAGLNLQDSDFSVEFWIKPDTTVNYNQEIASGGGWGGFFFHTTSGGDIVVGITTSANGRFITSGLTVGEWQHIAFTYEYTGSGDVNNAVLYKNGEQIDSATNMSSPTEAWNGFYVGDNDSSTLDGGVDEVKVYDYVLTRQEVLQSYSLGGPVAYYKFDKGVSGTAYDSSPNGLDLTLNNAQWSNDGKFFSAFDVESTSGNTYGSIDDTPELSITGDLSLSAWVKPESVTASTLFPIAGKWDALDSDYSYLLALYGDEVRMYIDSNTIYEQTTSANLSSGNWYNIAAIYDASGQSVQIYVNGALQSSSTTGSIPTSIGDDTEAFYIGMDGVGTANISTFTVSADGDDGFYYDGVWYGSGFTSDNYNYLGQWADVSDHSGVRFTNVTIAQGANIASAKLQLYGTYANNSDWSILIAGDGSATTFTSSYPGQFGSGDLPQNMTQTTNTVLWEPSSWPTGQFNDTVDISSIVQEYVDRADWDSGDVMRFALLDDGSGTNSEFGFEDYADSNSNHAKLVISTSAGTPNYFDGLIDEVKVYASTLSADQVLVEYNQGKVATLGLNSTTYSSRYCPPGYTGTCNAPVMELTFDNYSDDIGTIYDTSGNENNGAVYDDTGKILTPGVVGKAYDFNDDLVVVGASSTINNIWDGGGSVSFWANVKDTRIGDANGQFFNKNNDWWINPNEDDNTFGIRFRHDFSTTGANWDTSFGIIPRDEWFHVVVVYDSSSTSNDPIIYINGEAYIDDETPVGSANDDSSTALYIGTNNSNGPSVALMDEIMFFDYEISNEQVMWLYSKGAPIAHYKFDECSGTTIKDSAVYAFDDAVGNDGTLTIGGSGTQDASGSCSSGDTGDAWNNGASGQYGASISLDGSDDYVDLDSLNSVINTDAGSISLWAKMNPMSGIGVMYSSRVDSDNNIEIYWNDSTGVIWLKYKAGGTSKQVTTSIVTDADNNWHHYVITWDTEADGFYAYIDGEQVGTTQTALGTWAGSISTTRVGNQNTGSETNFFDGQIDEVKIYNYALTPEQVKLDYNQGSAVVFD